ncbi:hypothetical protein PTSG_13196 [Salpingoeca rosetta]|uniref:Uncharacterized protein n=1 Tax=Salpingoeca rosetta (strain ATCC 50818 / BSB-021) TaxID=946362 RepID=F2UTC9_SALR5|nr:uncharacterized protein PTSG_13196 [Salpingoeca rosetta]EGD82382.1 hypothetical protein PTSG_13196 [Salpingoeca rosetta]|eukprot:XP_004987576.1 hypothetical protein PTSG_13196 [Salpingoeca rosetta]
MNDNRSRSHYPPRQEQQTYAYKPEGLLPTPDPTPCLDMPSSSLSSTSTIKPAITPTASTSTSYVNPNWRQDVRVDDQVIERIFQSLPTPVDVHQPCHSHKDVRAAVGGRAFSALNRQLRPAFAHSRQALVVTLFMDWQKRMSNLNMQALYRRQHEFRETRGRRRELNLQTLARRHNIGVTALGMALVGGLFSKYFCLTPHHLDPTAKTELFHIVEDEAFLRLMVHNRKRIALVLQARECLRNAAVDSDDDENDEDGLEQNRNDDDDADDGNHGHQHGH